MDFSISHMYRENNQAAYFLANLGCNAGRLVMFDRFSIPRKLRGIVQVDNGGLQNLRPQKV